MKTIIDNIRNHSIIFGEPVFNEYTEISEERLQHVVKLIKSELNELIDAETIDEQKDGCGDVLWTVLRAFMEYGFEAKCTENNHNKRFIPFHESVNIISKYLHTIRNEKIRKEEIEYLLQGILFHSLELFKPFQYDRGLIMEQVYKSNMSKLCKTEQEAKDTVKAYAEGTHPNKLGKVIITHYEKAKEGFVVRRTSDNKYLKSINFVEPKF